MILSNIVILGLLMRGQKWGKPPLNILKKRKFSKRPPKRNSDAFKERITANRMQCIFTFLFCQFILDKDKQKIWDLII